MFFLGQVQHGIYVDEHDGIHPDVLNEYYGVQGKPREQIPGQSGAGHPPDEDDEDTESDDNAMDVDSLEDRIAQDYEHNFNHEAVKAPKHANPFTLSLSEEAFSEELLEKEATGFLPGGYGIHPDEWEGNGYPTYEIIRTGRRARKEIRVALPDAIWRPRAELWVRALYTMTTVLEIQMEVDSNSDNSNGSDSDE